MRPWSIAIAISLTLHSALFLSLAGSGSKHDKEGRKGKNQGYIDITPAIIEKLEGGGRGEPCEDWYGGIGITGWGRVDKVYKGYPAHRAGMKPGDLIVSDFFAIKGEPGTPVTVTVVRDDKTLIFTMIREKICTNGN